MQETVLTAGIVLVAAAIIGGGLKAFGIDVPILESRLRQVALLGFGGFLFFLALVVLADDDGPPVPSTTTVASDATGTSPPADTTSTSTSGTTIDTTGELSSATATGELAHCAQVSVTVGPVALENNQLWVPVVVSNEQDNDPINLPPFEEVILVDEAGKQYTVATFGQLENGRWPLGQTVTSGGTFTGRIIYERGRSGQIGSLTVGEIRNDNDPFSRCSVVIEGFGLP